MIPYEKFGKLRLESDPNTLRSLALDFTDFPAQAAGRVLEILDLPVRQGMSTAGIVDVLGEPYSVHSFVAGRKSYEFRTSGREPFIVSCNVLEEGGLSYLVVRLPLSGEDD
jgi:hypothetical protein